MLQKVERSLKSDAVLYWACEI